MRRTNNPQYDRPRHREPSLGRWPGLLTFLWRILVTTEHRSTSFYADRQRRMKAAFWFLLGSALGIALSLSAHASAWRSWTCPR